MNMLQMAWRNILRNPRRSLLSVLAVFMVSAVLVVGFSVLEGVKQDTVWNAQSFNTGTVRIVNPIYEKNKNLSPLHLNIPQADQVVAWARAQGETQVAAARVVFGCSISRGEKMYLAQGWGADLASEEQFSHLSQWLTQGRLPVGGEGIRETAIGTDLAKTLGLSLGDKFTFMTPTVSSSNRVTVKIVGLLHFPVAPLNLKTFVLPLEKAQYYLRMEGAALEVLVKTKEGIDPETVAARWSSVLKPQGLEAESWTKSALVYTMTRVVDIMFNVVALLFIILGSTVVVNTTMMVIFERKKEIGTLSALGMGGGALTRLFLLEAALLALVGATLGTVLGSGLTQVLNSVGIDFASLMNGIDIEFPSVLHPVLNLRSVVGTWFMISVLSTLAALVPSAQAAVREPVDSLRD